MGQPPCHDVVQRRHAVEQRNVLKCTGDALRGNLMRTHRSADSAFVPDLALLRMIAVNDIQH